MNPQEFASVLRMATPTTEALAALGIGRPSIDELQSRFKLRDRSASTPVSVLEDPVLDELFRRFDPSSIVIGPIEFSSRPEVVGVSWKIGRVEADPLLVRRATREVLVEDLSKEGHVLWRCAENPSRFLDALAIAVPMLASAMQDPKQESSSANVVGLCSAAAGGTRFRSFYEMLMG